MNERPSTPRQPPSPSVGASSEETDDAGDAGDASLLDALSPVEIEALRWSVRSVDAWLRAAPAHRAAYDDMAGVMSAFDEISAAGTARLRTSVAIDDAQQSSARDVAANARASASHPTARVDDARLDQSHGDAAEPVRAGVSAPSGGARWMRRLAPHALAAILAMGVLGGGWFGWDQWQRQPVFSQQFATARGQQLEARLPDGSRLQMDAATQADVTLYRHRREVALPEGQVVFHVQGDKARPFDVLAGGTRITVVGTTFAVRYTPSLGSQAVQVTVLEGKVRVARAQGDVAMLEALELVPGQAVSVDAQGHLGPITAAAPASAAPWLSARASFDNTALASVLAELRRYGDLPLRLGDASVGALPVTASVDLSDIGGFVRSLPQVLPVRLQQRDGITEIVGLPR
jgi:transmembrane sensor